VLVTCWNTNGSPARLKDAAIFAFADDDDLDNLEVKNEATQL
jgi:hypothetical protein